MKFRITLRTGLALGEYVAPAVLTADMIEPYDGLRQKAAQAGRDSQAVLHALLMDLSGRAGAWLLAIDTEAGTTTLVNSADVSRIEIV